MNRNAKVIVASSTKGGVGKSSIISNLGAYLALQKKHILFIDLDYQANLTSCANNVGTENLAKSAIIRAYQHDSKDVRSSFPNDFRPAHVNKYIDIMAAGRDLMKVNNLMRNQPAFAPYVLLHVFNALKLTSKYDYILIDCHNSFNIMTKGAMVVADFILTPVQPGRFSVGSVGTMIESIKDLRANLINPVTNQPFVTAKLFFVGNMVDFNTASSHQFANMIKHNTNFVASFHRRELFNRATTNYSSVFKQALEDAKKGRNSQHVIDSEIKPQFNKIINFVNGKDN